MNNLKLNISNLNFQINLPGLGPGRYRDLAQAFSRFINKNGDIPHEILKVVSLKRRQKGKIGPALSALIKKSLMIPFNKFPFPDDPESETENSLRDLDFFSQDNRFLSAFEGVNNPEEVVIYPFKRGCLVRKQESPGSTLFLKTGYFRGLNIEHIREAIYLTVSMALPLVNGVMLHGVGISNQGTGHLFLGLPGSGKTTIAGFSPQEDIISDDGIIVERDASGFYLVPAPINQSVPWGEDTERAPSCGKGLSAGFFLKKDKKNYLERLLPADACSIILKNHIHYFRYFPSDSVERTFNIISDMCRNVPFYNLHFRKDASFWALIENERSRIIGAGEINNGFK